MDTSKPVGAVMTKLAVPRSVAETVKLCAVETPLLHELNPLKVDVETVATAEETAPLAQVIMLLVNSVLEIKSILPSAFMSPKPSVKAASVLALTGNILPLLND